MEKVCPAFWLEFKQVSLHFGGISNNFLFVLMEFRNVPGHLVGFKNKTAGILVVIQTLSFGIQLELHQRAGILFEIQTGFPTLWLDFKTVLPAFNWK